MNPNREPAFTAPSILLPAVGVMLMLSAEMTAQILIVNEPMHVWVDPHDGVDAVAAASNPQPNLGALGCVSPSAANPMAVVPDPAFGPLMHAPYPFKTVTAAVAYLNLIFPAGLPVTNPVTGTPPKQYQTTVTHAIIHCLPGKYSRIITQDTHTLMFGNGETYPIALPNRVCIQGTSALNTVFYLEKTPTGQDPDVAEGPAFVFGSTPGTAGVETTIDSISIFGAPQESERFPVPLPRYFSAIHLSQDNPSSPTVTNTIIFACGIGVLVDAPPMVTSFHTPVLVNNTIAENKVGLWNGQSTVPVGGAGVSDLILINNIFDADFNFTTRTPTLPPQWLAALGATSGFEGVDVADLRIANYVPATNGDFNAYEAGRYNLFIPFPFLNLPTTAAGTSPAAPTIDIAPMTGGAVAGRDRGVLYIRDCLFNGSLLVAGTAGPFRGANLPAAPDLDLSPGDFRLCPDTAPATTGASTPPVPPGNTAAGGAPNLLVDRGWSGTFPVTMVNGRILALPPGQKWPVPPPPVLPHNWNFSSWDTDCEGFGNARKFDHPKYPPPGIPGSGTIDIGADELGSNIAVGCRFATTVFFSLENSPTPFRIKNRFIWFFGPANDNAAPVPGEYPRYTDGFPLSNMLPHIDLWDPAPAALAAYYDAEIVDIPPHLLPDIHPWWGLWLGGKPTNILWHHTGCTTPNFHNASLFNFPTVGHINPPGSLDNTAAPVNFHWLEEVNPLLTPLANKAMTKGPGASDNFDPTAGFGAGGWGSLFGFATWCQNRSPLPAIFTDHETWLATFPFQASIPTKPPFQSLRYSTEFRIGRAPPYGASNEASNLQSFMVLVEGQSGQ